MIAAHRAKMAAKKARRATLMPGFTPMPNKRVNAAMQTMALLIAAENADMVSKKLAAAMSTEELQREAVRRVARTLPGPAATKLNVRRHWSKNDDAAYRGVGGQGPVRQRVAAL